MGFGGVMFVRSLVTDGPPMAPIPWRAAAMVSVAIVAFGAMIEVAGYIPAAIAAPLLASFAIKDNRWRESTFFAILLAAGATLLFITALGQPLQYFGGN